MRHCKILKVAVLIGFSIPIVTSVTADETAKTADIRTDPYIDTYYSDEVPSGTEDTIWLVPRTATRAVAVVVHGLNLKPSRMDTIASELNKRGILVMRVSLTGHGGDISKFKHVKRSDWLNDLFRAYLIASETAKNLNVPLFYIGYSLGCPAVLDLICTEKDVSFDKAVFFAPAISLKVYTHLIRLGNLFGKTAVIPGRTPAPYRVNNGTPVAAYNALFEHIKSIKSNSSERLNFDILIFLDPKDELVSFKALQRFILNEGFDRWCLVSINTEDKYTTDSYHHLMIDPDTAGNEAWHAIIDQMSEHLSSEK
jgi:alpha-beta hydrolase superfamily lysophospholipase